MPKQGENGRNVFGVSEEGPTRELPIDIIRNAAETKYSGRDGQEEGLIDVVFDQDDDMNFELNRFTNDMLSKLRFWTYFGYFTNLKPEHSKDNSYVFSGQEYTDANKAKEKYDVPTRYLATTTFNCSDFLMGSGYGDSAIKGADMYLINKFFPKAANSELDSKSDSCKTIFRATRDGGGGGGGSRRTPWRC